MIFIDTVSLTVASYLKYEVHSQQNYYSTRNFIYVLSLLLLNSCQSLLTSDPAIEDLPEFSEPIRNITTTAGRDIKLACIVDKLDNYQVAWSHLDSKTLLAMHNRVITGNARYKVSNSHRRTWWLEIDNVQQRDSGHYMCQINTSPMKSQVGLLTVEVPPEIDEKRTSVDMLVTEKSAVSMVCYAHGYPEPSISWQREDGKDIVIKRKKVNMVQGNYLNITKVSRNHMGAYLCVAVNGVQPSVSKRIELSIKFPPKIILPNQLVGTPSGSDIRLECDVEVYPKAMMYWQKGSVMIISNSKYNLMSVTEDNSAYRTRMTLVINKVNKDDFGSYTCHVENHLGSTNASIRLYETRGSTLRSSSSVSAKFDKESNGSHNAMARTNSKTGKQKDNGFRIVKADELDGTDKTTDNSYSVSYNRFHVYICLFISRRLTHLLTNT